MSDRPVLCIDTAYDQATRTVQDGRRPLYKELKSQRSLVTFGPTLSSRARVLDELRKADNEGNPYGAILVTSHGAPGVVYDQHSPDGILLADSFPADELLLWARGRALYFMCCETGRGELLPRLSSLGASLVVGYQGKPQAQSESGWARWTELDAEIVRCMVATPTVAQVEAIRAAWLGRFDEWIHIHEGTPAYVKDLRDMRSTLQTMVIQ